MKIEEPDSEVDLLLDQKERTFLKFIIQMERFGDMFWIKVLLLSMISRFSRSIYIEESLAMGDAL